jgi:hypothetical protein
MPQLIKETKYLKFFKESNIHKKTFTIQVVNISMGKTIGLILWYTHWRQYCFHPNRDTIWNKDCLTSINEVITLLMDERKKKRDATIN